MYLLRQIASRSYNRELIGSEFTSTGHDRREKKRRSQLQQLLYYIFIYNIIYIYTYIFHILYIFIFIFILYIYIYIYIYTYILTSSNMPAISCTLQLMIDIFHLQSATSVLSRGSRRCWVSVGDWLIHDDATWSNWKLIERRRQLVANYIIHPIVEICR